MTLQIILLFLLIILAIGLLLILILSGSRQKHDSGNSSSEPPPAPKTYTDTGYMLQKIDERRRITDEFHHTKICDEYFELVFVLCNGEYLRVSCSKNAYKKVPFRKTGLLTYKNGRLIEFKTQEQVISEEYH